MNQFQIEELPLPQIFTDSQLLKLLIKQSKVNQAGMGIYTTQPIKSGQYIAQYYGSIIPEMYNCTQPFCMQNKMVYLSKKYCVISRSPASRANDIVKWDPQYFFSQANKQKREKKQSQTIQGLTRNASIKLVQKDKAFLQATRDIQVGQQIYIDYGFQYWQFFFQRAQKEKQE